MAAATVKESVEHVVRRGAADEATMTATAAPSVRRTQKSSLYR